MKKLITFLLLLQIFSWTGVNAQNNCLSDCLLRFKRSKAKLAICLIGCPICDLTLKTGKRCKSNFECIFQGGRGSVCARENKSDRFGSCIAGSCLFSSPYIGLRPNPFYPKFSFTPLPPSPDGPPARLFLNNFKRID